MKLMKKMYDEGDDDLKRTITKSWYEAQQKRGQSLEDWFDFHISKYMYNSMIMLNVRNSDTKG